MKTTKEYIVLETEEHFDARYAISKRDNFETMNFCETYASYGQKVSADTCGCEENGEHYEVLAWSYWDGSNWNSVIIDDEYSPWTEVDEETSKKILSEMPEVPYMDGPVESIETESFTFSCTRYQNDPWIFMVD